ncbi:diguanylate cyclase [Limoniibacter endophyticus]|uniref:diguanylate cyclase n=1 Tax=Limoniibacter endophyticus TaxID=1565040 RepID=A0A8J3GHX6_9HYPH|nr:diguanylate cyclase [Limoniibacter endophyticus]GHC73807.1 GGDEF domain-containing protein [Limoniibacter endophyticus]
MELPVALIALLNSVGLVALVAMAYGSVIRITGKPIHTGILTGLLFGAAGVISMIDPFVLDPGIMIDGRNLAVALSGLFGGGLSVVCTLVLVIGYRLLEGGVGIASGVPSAILSGVAGYYCMRSAAVRPYQPRTLVKLAALVSCSTATVFLLPWEFAVRIVSEFGFFFTLLNFVVILFAGQFLSREEARLKLEVRLTEEAATDPLTRLANRRTFDLKAPLLARNASVTDRPYSVLLIDIDHFKRINDTWGHPAGDDILRQIADLISEQVREGDLVSRYGGEEIALILPQLGAEEAQQVAERIRASVDTKQFRAGVQLIPVTVSIGVAVSSRPPRPFPIVFKAADEALYLAKHNGRNRIELAGGRPLLKNAAE